MKDKEWLKEEVRKFRTVTTFPFIVGSININSVLRLIDQLEEPEMTEKQAWKLIYDKYGSKQHDALYKIYLEQNGYTVEKKEKLYTVCFEDKKNVYRTGVFLYKEDGYVRSGNAMDNYDKEDSESHLTEKEIKYYDERFWQFAVPVEEEAE